MKINTDKTEVQYAGKYAVVIDVSVDGETLTQVKDFVYLGGKISSDGSSEEDVGRRIGLASGVMQALTKLWSSFQGHWTQYKGRSVRDTCPQSTALQ